MAEKKNTSIPAAQEGQAEPVVKPSKPVAAEKKTAAKTLKKVDPARKCVKWYKFFMLLQLFLP